MWISLAWSECLPDQQSNPVVSLWHTQEGALFDGHRNATFLKFPKARTLKYTHANKHTYIALITVPLTLCAISLYIAWMRSKNRSSELRVQIDRRINQTDDKTNDIITSLDWSNQNAMSDKTNSPSLSLTPFSFMCVLNCRCPCSFDCSLGICCVFRWPHQRAFLKALMPTHLSTHLLAHLY